MSKDDVLRKLPSAEVLDKRKTDKTRPRDTGKGGLGTREKVQQRSRGHQSQSLEKQDESGTTSEARRKDWQTVRNFMKIERTKPIEAIAITKMMTTPSNMEEKSMLSRRRAF